MGFDVLPAPVKAPRSEERKKRVRYIMPGDIEKYGYTPGCPGCKKVLAGSPGAAGNNNEKCRARIYKAIDEKEAKVKRDCRKKEKERIRNESGGGWKTRSHRWVSDRLPPAPGRESVQLRYTVDSCSPDAPPDFLAGLL